MYFHFTKKLDEEIRKIKRQAIEYIENNKTIVIYGDKFHYRMNPPELFNYNGRLIGLSFSHSILKGLLS